MKLRNFFARFRSAPTAPSPTPDELSWSDVQLGPNTRRNGQLPFVKPRVALQSRLIMDEKVAHRFNAYATSAFPKEIGGLLRIVPDGDDLRIIDVKIFPHVSASGGYFELDGDAVAQYNMDLLKEGRKNEIPEWCSLIHSHPNMTPFMSGTDKENLVRLAGNKHAFSVICSARSNPQRNYFDWHYAQGGENAFVIDGFHITAEDGCDLSGISSLDEDELQAIKEDVQQAFSTVRGYTSQGYRSYW